MASHVSWWEQPRRRGHCGEWALELASKTIQLSHWGSPKHCPQCLIKTFQGFFFVDSRSYHLKVWHFQNISSKEGPQFTKTNYYSVNLDRKDTIFESKSKTAFFVGQSPKSPFPFQTWPKFAPEDVLCPHSHDWKVSKLLGISGGRETVFRYLPLVVLEKENR